MRITAPPPRIGLRLGDQTWPAIPLSLRGDRVALLFRETPPADGEVRLILDWGDGAVTELDARVRRIEGDFSVVRFDVRKVEGDWQSFLAYLGEEDAA